jgi:DnaJ-class molecular chaperone
MGDTSYYKILGITKDASKDEIKKAYRKQSLKYHPDKNASADAQENFQKVNEAYQVLGDDEKRTEYDFMSNPSQSGRFAPGGMGMGMNMNIDEMFQGLFGFMPDAGNVRMGGMGNMGGMPSGFPFGNVHVFHGNMPFPMNMSQGIQRLQPIVKTINVTMEQVMNGANIPVEIERWIAQEGAKVMEKETIYVEIPQGVDDNELIVLKDRGNVANEMCKGDVKVFIKVDNHTNFKRNGLDLIVEKHITLKESLCGFKFELAHLNGKTYTINNNEGSIVTPSYFKAIPEMGLKRNGHSGNLVVTFDIIFPETLTSEQIKGLKSIL